MEGIPSVRSDASLAHRIRSVLAIRPFRRLWAVSFICSTGDWLSLLALSGLITKLTHDYAFQNYAFSGVVLTQLLPGLLFAPFGGVLADKFDRRKVMVACDLMRCGLLISIALVGTPLWLFAGNFLVGCCQLLWIPSKDAAIPNLLRRKDQVETANQLGLVMTWGISVISGAGLYALITGITAQLHVRLDDEGMQMATIIIVINGLFYLTSAIIVATRIPELSRRVAAAPPELKAGTGEPAEEKTGLLVMLRDAARFIRTTRLVRGLLVGMLGAFAAAGALVGSSKPYSSACSAVTRRSAGCSPRCSSAWARAWRARRRWPSGSRTTGCSASRSSRPASACCRSPRPRTCGCRWWRWRSSARVPGSRS